MIVKRHVEKKDGRTRVCPDVIEVDFKKMNWNGSGRGLVEAKIKTTQNDTFKLTGNWMTELWLENTSTKSKKLIWQAHPRPKDSDWLFHFTRFALQTNNLSPELQQQLPPTDSRLRPDMRAFENGDIELAASEKHRLEEKQRAARR